jgi:hypothetical protein
MYSWLCPWLLTWPDLKEKDQEGRTFGRLCELGSFPTVRFACAVEAGRYGPKVLFCCILMYCKVWSV